MALKRGAEEWAKNLVKGYVNRLPNSTYNPNNYVVKFAIMKSGSHSFQNPADVLQSSADSTYSRNNYVVEFAIV